MSDLKAPFTWFGGKSRVAPTVWKRLGDVGCFVEPFAGSLAVLLSRPHWPFPAEGRHYETVNDLNADLTNAWRAIQGAPDEVAKYADHPIHEIDLIARHRWNNTEAKKRVAKLKEDPHYFDAEAAGIWLWGMSLWIGQGWDVTPGKGSPPKMKMPHSTNQGINRKTGGGEGNEEQDADPGTGEERAAWLRSYMRALADRLRGVRVCCGDWARVLTPSLTVHVAPTVGVFLDPPYCGEDRADVYVHEDYGVAHKVREWAVKAGEDKRFRIALCGYEGEYKVPDTWSIFRWKAVGGFGNQRKDGGKNANRQRERIWFSPHCLLDDQGALSFGEGDAMAEANGPEQMENCTTEEKDKVVVPVAKPDPSPRPARPAAVLGKQDGMFGGPVAQGVIRDVQTVDELEGDSPADPALSATGQPVIPPEAASVSGAGNGGGGGECEAGGEGEAEVVSGDPKAEPSPQPEPAGKDAEGWF